MSLKERLMIFWQKNSDNFFLQQLHSIWREVERIKASKRLKKLSLKKPHSGKIKVVFLVNVISVWTKQEPVYEAMKNDERFEPIILCVPEYIYHYHSTYTYFERNGYNAINAYDEKTKKFYDLRSLSPDYVFYSKSYNGVLPPEYRSDVVSSYAKICLIPYAMSADIAGADEFPLNENFCRNVYCYYAEWEECKIFFEQKFKKNCMAGLQRAVNTGYPGLSNIIRHKKEYSKSWNFSKGSYRVLWTSRWDNENVFAYRDAFIGYAAKHDKIDFLFRPHPLLYTKLIEKGYMTEADVESDRNKVMNVLEHIPNVKIDKEPEYMTTLWNADVLIADYSSMIFEYFITGKPVIYCQDINIGHDIAGANKIYKTFYDAKDFDDILMYIERLEKGIDPLREARAEAIKEWFGNEKDILKIPSYILNDIASDFLGKK